MRIAILTIFAVPNYGAMLQAHGLSTHLRKAGLDAEIVNYKQPALKNYFRFKLRMLPEVNHWRRLWNCRCFVADTIHTSPMSIRNVDEFKSHLGRYDAFITGSDQVWFTGPVQYYDPMFFLDFPAPGKRKISYAASAGGNEAFGKFEEQVRKAVNDFDYLGVRDAHTASLVEPLTNKPLTQTVDPVYLYNFEDLLRNERPSHEPYMLVFGDFSGEFSRVVKDVRKATGLKKVVSLQYHCPEATERKAFPGPTEWLNWFRHADFVVTSYFHGSVLATKFQRPFISIPTPGRRHKVVTLLEPLGIRHRCFVNVSELEAIGDIARDGIDWSAVEAQLQPRIKASKDFIQNALS